jgi:hypothetical protein
MDLIYFLLVLISHEISLWYSKRVPFIQITWKERSICNHWIEKLNNSTKDFQFILSPLSTYLFVPTSPLCSIIQSCSIWSVVSGCHLNINLHNWEIWLKRDSWIHQFKVYKQKRMSELNEDEINIINWEGPLLIHFQVTAFENNPTPIFKGANCVFAFLG